MKKLLYKIAIGSDHNGLVHKKELISYLVGKNYIIKDFGQYNSSIAAKDFKVAEKVALAVSFKEFDRGILICGTGDGMCISANKIPGCYASLCYNNFSAEVARSRNNSNVIVFGGRTMAVSQMIEMLDIWLITSFLNGGDNRRNVERNNDLLRIDNKYRNKHTHEL